MSTVGSGFKCITGVCGTIKLIKYRTAIGTEYFRGGQEGHILGGVTGEILLGI
jgi:hypothetical protein